MSQLTRLRDFIFDPVKAALARGTTSSNPAVVAASQAGQATIAAAATDIAATLAHPLTANSAAALGSDLIKDGEDGVRMAMDGVITALLGGNIITATMTPEAVAVANAGLSFAEQHFLTYVSALFAHGKSQTVAPQP